MRLGMPIDYTGDFRLTIDNLVDSDMAGLDRVMIPEAYGFDAVSQMGYVAAKTHAERVAQMETLKDACG
jgi:hypothetical protein